MTKCSDDEFAQLFREKGAKKTAEHLQVSERGVHRRRRRMEARLGITIEGEIADTFSVQGRSTLYDNDGKPVLEWVKTGRAAGSREVLFQTFLDSLKEEIPKAPAVRRPKNGDTNLMSLYPVGDHHFGMLAWGEETGGADYDLTTARALLSNAIDKLVEQSCSSENAAILILGDFLHYDSFIPVTPTNKNILDADNRFPKMVRTAVTALRELIEKVLRRHKKVHLIIEIGNHDLAGAIWMMEAFSMMYEDEPRLIVDKTPRPFHCFTFGQNMVGTHHGHAVKMAKLPLLFATDWAEEWGATKYRTIHTGHVHHDHILELEGCIVESHGILAPNDAFSAGRGYRSRQSMKSICLHKQYGEVSRYTVNPEMLK
jgi:hypothetical protein